MADRHVTSQVCEFLPAEDIADETPAPERANEMPVGGRDTRSFLASVLERVQPKVGQVGRLGVSEDTKHTALITECIRSKLRVVGHWVATGSEGADSYPVATECAP